MSVILPQLSRRMKLIVSIKDFLNVDSLHNVLHNIFNTFGQKEFNIYFTLNY
jgi:hypothetical protein